MTKSLYGHLAADALLHQATHGVGRVGVVALEEHELGDGALDGHVAAADDAGLLEMVAAVVARHLDGALQTLADVDDHLAVRRALLQGAEQPCRLRRVARAEGAHDDRFQVRRVDDMSDEVFADAREEGEDDDVVVEPEVGRHVHAGIDEVGEVERLEGVELLGALLRGAVAAQQPAVEVDAHLGHQCMVLVVAGRRDLYRRDEVLLAVGS